MSDKRKRFGVQISKEAMNEAIEQLEAGYSDHSVLILLAALSLFTFLTYAVRHEGILHRIAESFEQLFQGE